ncbi:hypothetical protein WK11_29010 [Burkholderia ubonensis]|nr:hypothetical protein WK11_29010 [Burkholderia ubonensis]
MAVGAVDLITEIEIVDWIVGLDEGLACGVGGARRSSTIALDSADKSMDAASAMRGRQCASEKMEHFGH